MRSAAPTSDGTAMSQNIWSTLRTKPAAGSCGTTMLHDAQTANPRNSANTDRPRLRRAMTRPTAAHWPPSSGFQPSIHRPGRWTSGAGAVSRTGAVPVPVASWVAMRTSGGRVGSVSTTTLGSACFDRPARPVARSDPFAHRLPRGPVRSGKRPHPHVLGRDREPDGRADVQTEQRDLGRRDVDEHVAGGPQAHPGGAG